MRVRLDGDAMFAVTRSASLRVTPRVQISRPMGLTTVYRAGTYAGTGNLKPRHHAGTKPITIQAFHYEHSEWVLRKIFKARIVNYSSYSKYKASVRVPLRGKWRLRAYHPKDALNAAAYSSWRYIIAK